jgi:hypothetical protein
LQGDLFLRGLAGRKTLDDEPISRIPMIDPGTLAFDIDGVVADTMTLFLEIARDEFNINSIRLSRSATGMNWKH